MDDDKYFLCHLDQFKHVASEIEHIPLPLRTRLAQFTAFTCRVMIYGIYDEVW